MVADNIKSRVSGKYPLVIASGWSSTTVRVCQVWPAWAQEFDHLSHELAREIFLVAAARRRLLGG